MPNRRLFPLAYDPAPYRNRPAPDRRGAGLHMGDGPRFQDAAPARRASHEAGVHWAHLAPNRDRSLNYSVKQGKHRYDCPSCRANQKHRIPECSGRIRHQAGSGAQSAQACRMGHFRRFAGCTRIYGWDRPRRLRAQARLTQRRTHRGQAPQRKTGKTSTAAAGVLLSGRGEAGRADQRADLVALSAPAGGGVGNRDGS